jgi:hypothetical protein
MQPHPDPHFAPSVAIALAARPAAPRVHFIATRATLEEPTMFDRLFMPALTFTLLIAGFAAFADDIARSAPTPPQVVQLERVVVVGAQRELPTTPVARADADPSASVVAR